MLDYLVMTMKVGMEVQRKGFKVKNYITACNWCSLKHALFIYTAHCIRMLKSPDLSFARNVTRMSNIVTECVHEKVPSKLYTVIYNSNEAKVARQLNLKSLAAMPSGNFLLNTRWLDSPQCYCWSWCDNKNTFLKCSIKFMYAHFQSIPIWLPSFQQELIAYCHIMKC